MSKDNSKIDSPCVKECSVNRKGICPACGRTLDEICRWAVMEEEERRLIMASLPKRKESQAE